MSGWNELSGVNQGLFAVAVFCTVFLIAQLIMSADGHHDVHHPHGSVGDVLSTALLSVRSLLAFATLFSWAAALYLATGHGWAFVIPVSLGWGLAGSGVVAGVMYGIRWAHAPHSDPLSGCVGQEATVVLAIPAGGAGEGEVKVMLGGRVQHVRAQSDEARLEVGTRVLVIDVAGPNTVKVVVQS